MNRLSPTTRTEVPAAGGPSRSAPLVVWSIIGLGAVALGGSLLAVSAEAAWGQLVPFLALAAVAEILSFEVYAARDERISLSFSVAVTMAAVAAVPLGAPLVYLTATAAHALTTRQRRVDKVLFNLTNPALAAAAASLVFRLLRPTPDELTLETLVAALAAVATFHVTNVGLLALVISLHARRPLGAVLRESAWYAPNKLVLGLMGAFLVVVYHQQGLLGMLVFAAPLGILRYTLAVYTRHSQRSMATLKHQAHHDALTGLPNRTLLHERLHQAMRAQEGALLLLDLDRFKEINDTFGHHYGDLLLQEVGARLRRLLQQTDTVARLGGDEFGLLLPQADAAIANHVAQQVVHLFEEPMVVDNQRVQVSGSIGLALYPDDGPDADTLFRRADVAMYVAKQARSGYVRYRPEQDQYNPERLALIADLRQAIEQDELVLHYQPQVAVQTGRVTSVEALVRWQHPQRGFIPPDQFIGLAEHTGLIRALTDWVLKRAIRECRAWWEAGHELPVAVNVSPHDLRDGTLPEHVAALLAAHATPAHLLRLEMTEGAIMADPVRGLEVLARLRALGVGVSIDDYGTGYASLAYLSRLPVDELKIDRSFVQHLATEAKQRAIVRSTIDLGHELGLTIVAEGVEDQATWDLLDRLGCDMVQGYLVSRPRPAAGLVRWLAAAPWSPHIHVAA